jgi:(1->4)-alpha-D-glucan 1-alpha-D-glucosylmutase
MGYQASNGMMRVASSVPVTDNLALSSCLDRIYAEKDSKRPLSTYRLQFNKNFTFEHARQLLPYLHALGVTHCYASPILMARAGSPHGYDIINHNQINPEIGSEEEFQSFVRELKSLGMGLLLDIVPNHMGIGHGTNPWWQDVLENGQASEYADFFDIDWCPLKQELHNKVLLPVLGGSYGEELEQGRIQLKYEDDSFFVTYYDKRFPIDPASYPLIFDQVGDFHDYRPDTSWRQFDFPALQAILKSFGELAPHYSQDAERVTKRRAEIPELKRRLAELYGRSSNVREAVAEVLRRNNGDVQDPRSFDSLHRVLEAQAYRLAHWRVSTEEINYRRFFDINDLVGLRMENPAVFAETHKLLRKLLADGSIDGLRLDHPDGLFNPVQYFTRVQMLDAASHCCGPEPTGKVAPNGIEEEVVTQFSARPVEHQTPLYLLVEKILEHGEQLPNDWPVDGTVGYEFGNALNHLFINSRAQRFFRNFYHRFIGGPIDVSNLIYESKMLIMRSSLSSEVTVLTHMLQEISSSDRRARDITRALLKDAIREVIACFPVYRTYIDARGTVSDRDRGYILEAIARAKRRNANETTAPYDFLKSVLLLDNSSGTLSADQQRKRLRFTLKFQQLSGPVMAKGLEDTACYIYSRFISANEVGGSPASFGISQEEFHHGNLERAREWTFSISGTSTHDSKRSEDVRARLNVLSEMPTQWAAQVVRWRRANRSKKRMLGDGRNVPDPNEEYFLYQTLVGVWPFSMSSQAEREEFTKRIQDYMTKAVHEAKVNLSWINQNQDYVDGLRQFIARILTPGTSKKQNAFLQRMEKFLPPVMFFGSINGLAQVLLKITSPGVPDVYRGCEFWDFSLVDPDNRRPVDYETRQQALAELLSYDDRAKANGFFGNLLENFQDSRVKLFTTVRALRFRRDNPELFRHSEYIPLFVNGPLREHLVAFARRREGRVAITVVPRFSYTLMKGEMRAPLGEEAWQDAELEVPEGTGNQLTNVLTGERVEVRNGRILCREVFSNFPLALLTTA